MMFFGEASTPPYINGEGVCRDANFPTVTPLKECGCGKSDGGMAGWEGMAIGSVGASLIYGIFEHICGACRCHPGEESFFQSFPVLHDKDAGERSDGQC